MKPEVQIGAVHNGKGRKRKAPQGPRWKGATTQRRNSSQPMWAYTSPQLSTVLSEGRGVQQVKKQKHFKRVCKSGKGPRGGGGEQDRIRIDRRRCFPWNCQTRQHRPLGN